MKASVDQDKCIGCGTCAAVCPDSFRVKGAKAQFTGTASDCISKAIESCPVQAINKE